MITQEILEQARRQGREGYATISENLEYSQKFYRSNGEELMYLGSVVGVKGGNVHIFNINSDWHNNITESTFMRDLLLARKYKSKGIYLTHKETVLYRIEQNTKAANKLLDMIEE